MSDFVLMTPNKNEIYFVLNKVTPITEVPIVDLMYTLEEIENEYNEPLSLYVIIFMTVGSTVVEAL